MQLLLTENSSSSAPGHVTLSPAPSHFLSPSSCTKSGRATGSSTSTSPSTWSGKRDAGVGPAPQAQARGGESLVGCHLGKCPRVSQYLGTCLNWKSLCRGPRVSGRTGSLGQPQFKQFIRSQEGRVPPPRPAAGRPAAFLAALRRAKELTQNVSSPRKTPVPRAGRGADWTQQRVSHANM